MEYASGQYERSTDTSLDQIDDEGECVYPSFVLFKLVVFLFFFFFFLVLLIPITLLVAGKVRRKY